MLVGANGLCEEAASASFVYQKDMILRYFSLLAKGILGGGFALVSISVGDPLCCASRHSCRATGLFIGAAHTKVHSEFYLQNKKTFFV
jgi:hypothetical protein